MFSRLVNEMAEKQGVTEQLKATKPMLWVGKMNAVRSTAILKDQRLLFNTFIQKQYVETLCFQKYLSQYSRDSSKNCFSISRSRYIP